jgi:hypothetical protein
VPAGAWQMEMLTVWLHACARCGNPLRPTERQGGRLVSRLKDTTIGNWAYVGYSRRSAFPPAVQIRVSRPTSYPTDEADFLVDPHPHNRLPFRQVTSLTANFEVQAQSYVDDGIR